MIHIIYILHIICMFSLCLVRGLLLDESWNFCSSNYTSLKLCMYCIAGFLCENFDLAIDLIHSQH